MRNFAKHVLFASMLLTSGASYAQSVAFSGSHTSFPTSFTFDGAVYEGTTNGGLGGPSGWGPNNTVNLTTLPLNTHVYDKPNADTRYTFYRQPYSVVIGNIDQSVSGGDYTYIRDVFGHITPTAGIPASGTVTYNGRTVWHDLDLAGNREGDFTYAINFGTMTGSGSISNLKGGSGWQAFTASGTLDPATIAYDSSDQTWGVKGGTGSVTTNNPTVNLIWALSGLNPTYDLALFGPNAEEVAGAVTLSTALGSLGIAGKQ